MVTEKEQRENGIVRTFRDIRSEMKKVVWPTREETTRLTVIVIAISVVISVILYSADALFSYLVLLLQRLASG